MPIKIDTRGAFISCSMSACGVRVSATGRKRMDDVYEYRAN